ncbi:MAG TPA: hypothetical protein VK832_14635 [Burkholderiaceae bacterium]|nr:hypothetical protein [Burkholderiaceae bacterium]
MQVQLVRIAHARGGDKGDKADLSLFAYDAATYAVLKHVVTAERVAAHFAGIAFGPVECFDLDNLLALKFVLHQALDGGAARSLRSDGLGKSLAAGLLRMMVEVPEGLAVRHTGPL